LPADACSAAAIRDFALVKVGRIAVWYPNQPALPLQQETEG
jgi:hypothetical protein